MSVFRSIVFTAAAAGLVVGIASTGLQHLGTLPLIQKAEVFERQAAKPEAQAAPQEQAVQPAHEHPAQGVQAAAHDHGAGAHEHGVAAWEPADGFERNAYTALFNVVEWIGFGLLLAGALVLAGRPTGWREGVFWGLGGFVAFSLAPGLGLPPELPGVPAAALEARQVWWIGTAAATAGGLALLALNRSVFGAVLGLLLIAAPHLVGAPRLAVVETNVPEVMAHRFVVTVLLTTLASWVLLGGLSGYLLSRLSGGQGRTPA
ncbi:MAG: CbtA family protein [Alsobacter sp.]